MDAFPVPRLLAEAARIDPSAPRRAWMAGLPGTVRGIAERWELRLAEPYQPGGACSWVAPARDPAGRDLVLKVGWGVEESAHEAEALRRWSGRGAVLLHASLTDGPTYALLLERCEPGTTLRERCEEPEQDEVIAGLLPRLWAAPADGPFRSLESMCHDWADRFEADRFEADRGTARGAGPHGGPPLDAGLAREGMRLFRELPATAGHRVLLATDLHAQNVLAARRAPWLVIDPKPYAGDPTYDALQHMLNCRRRLLGDPAGFADRMAGLLGLDAARLRLWLFARAVQESPRQPWLAEVVRRLAPR